MSTKYIFTSLKMLRITLVLFIVGEAVAQINSKLSCPNLQAVKDVDLAGFAGKWYQYANYDAKNNIYKTKCVTATYARSGDGSFDVTYEETSLDGDVTHITKFKATPAGNTNYGLFTTTPNGAPYWILATDFKNFAFVWSCRTSKDGSTRYARILTREPNPSELVIKWVNAMLRSRNLDEPSLTQTTKTGCPPSYYKRGN